MSSWIYIHVHSIDNIRSLVKSYKVLSMMWSVNLNYNIFDLLPFYTILRSIPNKLIGVIGILGAILILLAIPILDTGRVRSNQFRPLMRIAYWILVADFFLLIHLGAQHAEEPYVTLGALATIVYFGWFFILVPMVGIIENTLIDIARDDSEVISSSSFSQSILSHN